MNQDHSHLRSTVNQDGAAVLDTRLGTITTLNPTGAFIWQALEQGQREDEIVAMLAEDTGESPEVIASDVRRFVADLLASKLLPR